MKKVALITGASSGLGEEFARLHAQDGDNLVLVARSEDKLTALKRELEEKHGIEVLVIAKDLSKENSGKEVYEQLQRASIQVEYLLNNAGFGHLGAFAENEWAKEETMINLNVRSLTEMTKLFLPQMLARKSGRILNVSSTAAFQPGPLMAVYYASKHYVQAFSQALEEEVRGTGVSVTTLCPGATETGFQKNADMENSKLFKGKKLPTAKEVAEFGYKRMKQGKGVVIHGTMNSIMARFASLLPSRLTAKIAMKMQAPE